MIQNQPNAFTKEQPIFLLGFMGCGKSTIGRKLAAKTTYNFIDLDKVLEDRAGTSIADFFSAHGETAFRELERDVLQHSNFPVHSIIATGGGAPCFFDNMDWMNANGTTVYINLSPAALASRLENGRAERPLLNGMDDEQLIAFITEKLTERELFYKQAQHIVSGIDLNTEKLIEQLSAASGDIRHH